MTHFLWLIPLSVVSAVLGRMGGAVGYDTKYRDAGCSIIAVIATGLIVGWHLEFWWVYLAVFVLHWGAFSTYWDWLFGGKDTMWFSGIMVGLALSPIVFINKWFILLVVFRVIFLGVVWEVLNRTVSKWKDGDIIEENLRYAASL